MKPFFRKPLTKDQIEALNGVLERAAKRAEERKRLASTDAGRTLTGILAVLDKEPREA
jgi:hypothetical protein